MKLHELGRVLPRICGQRAVCLESRIRTVSCTPGALLEGLSLDGGHSKGTHNPPEQSGCMASSLCQEACTATCSAEPRPWRGLLLPAPAPAEAPGHADGTRRLPAQAATPQPAFGIRPTTLYRVLHAAG